MRRLGVTLRVDRGPGLLRGFDQDATTNVLISEIVVGGFPITRYHGPDMPEVEKLLVLLGFDVEGKE